MTKTGLETHPTTQFSSFETEPNGSRLLSAGMGSLKEWELALDRPVTTFQVKSTSQQTLGQFAFSRDGQSLAVVTTDGMVQLYRWPSGVCLHA